MSMTHKHSGTRSHGRREFVIGETRREDIASASDIEIQSGAGSILDDDVHLEFEEIRNSVIEDLRQDIEALRRSHHHRR